MESEAFTPRGRIDPALNTGSYCNMLPPPFPPLPSDVETLPGLDQGERIGRLVQELGRLRRERDEARQQLTLLSAPAPARMPRWLAPVGSLGVLLLPALGAALAKRWPHLAAPIDAVLQLALDVLHGLGL